VFLFNSPADYAAYMTGCPSVPSNVFGYTFFSPTCPITGNQTYTVIFETSSYPLANDWVDNVAAHEMGHWIDERVLGTSASPYSSGLFATQMNTGDYPHFNGLVGQCTTPDRVFNSIKDNKATPGFICSNNGAGPTLSSGYSGTSTTVLNAAVPSFYSDSAELFAQEVAVLTGDVTQREFVDKHLERGHFPCTQTLLQSVLNYGDPPGVGNSPYQDLPAACTYP
jgi:hypothetical protein